MTKLCSANFALISFVKFGMPIPGSITTQWEFLDGAMIQQLVA
jgi:hypothetical protein